MSTTTDRLVETVGDLFRIPRPCHLPTTPSTFISASELSVSGRTVLSRHGGYADDGDDRSVAVSRRRRETSPKVRCTATTSAP